MFYFSPTKSHLLFLSDTTSPLPASDVTILGTTEWPHYQTARMSTSAFRADVPNGMYRITLSLCELETVGEQEMSPYNLGNKALDTGFAGRQMSIAINDDLVADALRLDTYRVPLTCSILLKLPMDILMWFSLLLKAQRFSTPSR